MSIVIYIAVMAGVTYLVRMIPFTLMKKKIYSRFLKSFLYYIPYAVPDAANATTISGRPIYARITALLGTVVAVILAYIGLPLIVVALAASGTALIASLLR